MAGDPTRTLKVGAPGVSPGQTIAGKFRILKEIGRGGMGVVYEAEDLRLKRTVALKFLPPGLTSDPELRERFIHEARAASSLDHPNICTIHEIDEAEAGGMYIAMACYGGESLKEKIRRAPLDSRDTIGIGLQIAEGLAKAHEQGIVHRDVKPGNVMVTGDGVAKILDFGLAKLAGEARLTMAGTTVGTVAYMSPEQAKGEDADARTDVWSLGVVLYEMATGELPFGRDSDRAVLNAIVHEPPRPVKALPSGYPAEFAQVIDRALAKDPARRFASAQEMAAALRDLKMRMTARAYPEAGRLSFRRSRRRLLLAAGTLSLAAVAVAIWLLSRPSLAFERRDKIMVADVENLTSEKVFDLALRTAIETSLQQSPYAAVFDRPQMGETLRLMRTDPSSRVDEKLGYDLCRFAGVRAFILPRILSAGEAYELEAILIDPVKRRHVDRFRVTARGREEVLLKAIDKLTRELRSRLGESLNSIEKAGKPVSSVSTSSWEAMDYFSLAQVKREQGKFKEAAALYELALDKDPKFVAARSSLALVLIQFMSEPDQGKKMLSQAREDGVSQKLPARDLLSLKALCRQFVDGDLEGALGDYKTLIELFPDLMPPYNNSGRILQALGRFDEAAGMYEKAWERAPRSSIPLQNLWFLQMNMRKDAAASESAARRMVGLAPSLAYPHAYLGYSLAVQEKFTESEKELRKTLEIEPDHPYALPNLAHVLFAEGKAAEAVPYYRRVVALDKERKSEGTILWDSIALGLVQREAGLATEARETLDGLRPGLEKATRRPAADPGEMIALAALEAIAGNRAKAEACLGQVRPAELKDGNTLCNLAGLYAILGRTGPAVEAIKRAVAAGFSDPFFPVILPELQSVRKDPQFRRAFKLSL